MKYSRHATFTKSGWGAKITPNDLLKVQQVLKRNKSIHSVQLGLSSWNTEDDD